MPSRFNSIRSQGPPKLSCFQISVNVGIGPDRQTRAVQDLDDMTCTCKAAVRDGTMPAAREALIRDSEQRWRQGMAVLLRISAKGEDTTELTKALERLRVARLDLTVARARR
jgi:hypothetical protein